VRDELVITILSVGLVGLLAVLVWLQARLHRARAPDRDDLTAGPRNGR
jgi:hypothetical protein